MRLSSFALMLTGVCASVACSSHGEVGSAGNGTTGTGGETGGSAGSAGQGGATEAGEDGDLSNVGGGISTDGGLGESDGSGAGPTETGSGGAGPAVDASSMAGADATSDARFSPVDGAAALVYPAAAAAGDIAAGIDQLNRFRGTVGENAVTLDPASSAGCEAHIGYLVEEATKLGQAGYLEHTEMDTANTHASAAGAAAGLASDLAWGQATNRGVVTYQSLGQAVDLWINGLYHRHPLFDPGLVKVGAASSLGYNCLNYGQAGNGTVVRLPMPTLWPADGMTNVPLAFGGSEGPCPTAASPTTATTCPSSGFIASATFYNWGTNQRSAIQTVSSVTLTDETTQASLPLFAWYADRVAGHDPAAGFMRDELSLVPQMSLGANTSYRVNVVGTFVGTQTVTNLSWRFSTGMRTN